MIRDRIFVVLMAMAFGLAACSSGTSGAGGSTSPAASSGTSVSSGATGPTSGESNPGGSLETSPLRGVTKLTKAQLCGVLSSGDASHILGAAASAPTFANSLGLGITCTWRQGSATYGLYVGISTLFDFAGAKGVDHLLKTTSSTIDGHAAIVADLQGANDYAQIDVALGSDHDPVVEYRAPSVAIATLLATTVTPKLIALGSS
jgi:hypothetical protein